MKKLTLILLALFLFTSQAHAQRQFVRNDSAATTLNALNNQASLAAVTSKGEILVGPGTNSTSLGKSEDAPASSGDTGVFDLSVRNDPLTASTNNNGDYQEFSTDALGALWVRETLQGTPTLTTPSVTTATSFTCLAANASRKSLLFQNNSAANIMLSLSGATLTGIVPTSTNIGIVLTPGSSYQSPPNYVSVSAITCYQTSGSTINTIVVVEG